MYRLLLSLAALMITTCASSQFLAYAYNGELVKELHYANYKGSPFLFKDWGPAAIKIGDQYFKSDLFNVDLYANKPYFKVNDSLFEFKDNVNEFLVVSNEDTVIYKRGNLFHEQLGSGFTEVISHTPWVVKQPKINLSEQATYGYATKEFQFIKAFGYFVQNDKSIKRIKLSKEEAQNVFNDKWSAVEAYASNNKISFKTEEGWRALSKYYSTIK